MASRKLCLILLLSSCTLAQENPDQPEQTTCLLGSRLKPHKKYVYAYSTDSRNGVAGAANLRNGPKLSCQVQIEVPHMCRFIMHTRDCTLSEVSVMDPQGQPMYRPAPGAEAFKASMEKNPLKFSAENETNVQLYPASDEPINVLNIKRGIVSALLVPVLDDAQQTHVSTVHGRCSTRFTVSATDVTLSRDLSQCDHFYSRELASSPVALLQKLHNPLSKLITSTQSCNYQFDDKGKHITSGTCTEKHLYLPFSYRENGISSVVKQELSFQSVKKHGDKLFEADRDQAKPLAFEDPDDKAPVQTKEAVLSTLQELVGLPATDQGQKRAGLFHKLVSGMRVLRNETLSQTVAEMVEVSPWLSFQALIQCGTSECTSAIMQVIWSIDGVSLEVDALVYGLSLQDNPDAARVRDMLSMAEYRQSKAIMYALANTVKEFYWGDDIPLVTDVAKFMEMLLNDCKDEVQDTQTDFPADPKEVSFLVLKVVGVMGQHMQAVSPSLVSSILQCAKKTETPLSNQKAAIQALRLMELNNEIRSTLMELYLDAQSPVEKRLAAYMVLMKNPDRSLLRDVLSSLMEEKDEQIRSFVVSHLNNIRSSDDPQMLQFREDIDAALRGDLSPSDSVSASMSRNYRMDFPLGSVETNLILDGKDTMPKEMMLEATLKAFNIFQVGVEGTGFQPTMDSLFGEEGFFPEFVSKLIQLAGDSAPTLKDVLEKISSPQARKKRQTSDDFLTALTESFQKLVNNVQASPSPEATAYFRLLSNEIGYVKTSEIRKTFQTLLTYYQVYLRALPAQAFFKLTSSTENQLFFHYIFMENTFSLPTASGLPLKFSLSGVFAPGAKGGLTPSSVSRLSFMPSLGLEFITQMGVHIPDYVDAGVEMHTNVYHESAVNVKVSVSRNQVKLSVPAPESNTLLFSISNKLLSVSAGQTKMVPSLVEDRVDSTDCQPLFTGLNLCTKVRYSNASSVDQAPYYPLGGETTFAVEIQSTGKITEYSATIKDETLREGKKGRNKMESLKLTLKAEGEEPMEATAAVKYNLNKNLVSAEVVIPDFDVEAGVKLEVTKGDTNGQKMRGITIDVTNKNIPQLSLVGIARLDQMREVMLQLKMEIPSLESEGSVSMVMKKDENVLLELETVAKIPGSSYQQTTSLKYDDDKFEVELKTDLNSEIKKLIPSAEEHHKQLQKLIDDILDQQVAKTDMKLRHIVSKGIVAGNIWLDKLTARFPSLENLRSKRSLTDLTLPELPKNLFLQSESLFRYQFNKEKTTVSIPLPLGGKTSEEMNLPMTLSIPSIDLPLIGVSIPAKTFSLPSFTVPPSVDLTVPLLGLAKASTKIHSNLYTWEGSISAGNDTVDVPSYVAQYKMEAQSPFCLLSYKLEGIGLISGIPNENLKYLLNSSFSHCLINTSLSVLETIRVSDKLNGRANYKFEASSPLGLQASVYYSAQSTSTPNSEEVMGDGTIDGLLKLGSFYTNTSYTHSYNLKPKDREGKGESTMYFDSPLIQFDNMIQGTYANSELNIISKSSALWDIFKHDAELKYKDRQLTLKCGAVGTAMGTSLKNHVELGVSTHMSLFRIESQADDDKNRLYSLISGSLDSNGFEINSEGSTTFDWGRGLHKASVKAGKDGLTYDGTNSIQCSPITMENIFNGVINSNSASLFSTTKAMAEESRAQLNIEGKITGSEASLKGELKGHSYDATTANNLNIVLNHEALTFTGNTKGILRQMKTENSHTLTLTLWTLHLRSKTDNYICDDIYYKHDAKVNMKPFVMALDMTNDLKFYDLSINNEGHFKVEPVKVDLSGSVMGAYGEDHNIKHTYELTNNKTSGSMKYNTDATVMDAKLRHNCELKYVGFVLTSFCEADINSEPLRFDGHIRTKAMPFSLIIDAHAKSDGKVNLLGVHTVNTDSDLLFKVVPLAYECMHEHKLSTTHMLSDSEFSTGLGNTFRVVLTPTEQTSLWTLNSKFNKHVYEQAISAYNNPEKIGVEISGKMQTDIATRFRRSTPTTQTFAMTSYLQYDKSSDCHIIKIPFIESFPIAFEQLKNSLLQALESLQQFILNLNINQVIKDFRDSVDQIPAQVKNLIKKVDLENKVNTVKDNIDYVIAEFAVSMKDFESAMENLKQKVEATVTDIVTKVQDFFSTLEEHMKTGHLKDKITDGLADIGEQLQAFDEKYQIKQSFIKILVILEDILGQIDLQKLKESSVAFLQELDSKYGIIETIKEKISEFKQAIEGFSFNQILDEVKNYIFSFDWGSYVEQLSYNIPASEITKVLESMKDVIVNWIDEYEVPQKINAVIDYIKNFITKHNLDSISKDLLDQTVTLVKEFKIEETVQSVVDALKAMKLELIYDETMNLLAKVKNHLQEIDFRKSIEDLNERISSVLKQITEFDYDSFVDSTNAKIAELTQYINGELEKYEIVQKIEALREYVREIQNSVYKYLDELKMTKVADALKKLKDLIDTAFYNDIKLKIQDILEDMRQRILDMDIRDEIYIFLERRSESYKNIIAFISAEITQLMEKIRAVDLLKELVNHVDQVINGVLSVLQRAQIEFPSFTIPLTDLVVPAFTINLNELKDIKIPAQIFVPEFTILGSYTIPAITIDFEQLKVKIVEMIDKISAFEIETPDPEEIFGDLKVLYLFDLPDLTLPEITLLEIKFPPKIIPKFDKRDFAIRDIIFKSIEMPKIPSEICIPMFGKLHGKFTITSPEFTLETTGKIENSTSTLKNQKFTATINSQAKSPIESLEYTFEAKAQIEAPRMKKLLFTETVKVTHVAFKVDHEGSLTLASSTIESSAKTTAKAMTQMYTADLTNNISLSFQNGIHSTVATTYSHNLDIPSIETSSQVTLTHDLMASKESGILTVKSQTDVNGKCSVKDHSDEGTHKSSLVLTMDFNTVNLTFEGDTNCKTLKMKQTLNVESVFLNQIIVEGKCDSTTPILKDVMNLNGKVDIGDLDVKLTASHVAEFTDSQPPLASNSIAFEIRPFEFILDVKNKVNSKLVLPLKLTGRLDFLNDYGVVLNSEKQEAQWVALARFNQYKYSHDISVKSSEIDIIFLSSIYGEANLEFLTVPLSIPEMTIPHLEITIPEVKDFSLWEHTGLNHLLITPQQSLNIDLKLQYSKNPERHSYELHLEPIYNAISENAQTIQTHFEVYRDKIVGFLKDSYNEAKSHYIKHKIDTSSLPPRIFRVPGYTIPVLNIQVSAFSAEMPAFTYFVPKEVSTPSFKVPALAFSVPSYTLVLPSLRLPVIHVPETLGEMKLPAFALPDVQDTITIPAMGNLTYDFSFKSTVVTVSANAGLYNESDIVLRFSASSVSVFDILKGKIDGTSSLARTRGLKLATSVSLNHKNVEANHECAINFNKKSLDASMNNIAKINSHFLNLGFNHELKGNTKTKPHISSKKTLTYMFSIPLIESFGRGNLETTWQLETHLSSLSMEMATEGNSDIIIMNNNLVGLLLNEASFYLNANTLRSTAKTTMKLNMEKQEKQKRSSDGNFLLDLDNNMALEVSLRRVYALLKHTGTNNVDLAFLETNGKHVFQGELDFVPLTSFKATVQSEANQKSGLGDTELNHNINLALGNEKQTFSWSGKEKLGSLIQACDFSLSNGESEIRLDFTGSAEGHLAFLKSVQLPVYQKSLWDVLKFDAVTNTDSLQSFKISSAVVYTKSMDGHEYFIPTRMFTNGMTFQIPQISLALPTWLKEIPQAIKNIDKRFEDVEVPENLILPPVISVPAFQVPFTDLHVEPFNIDPKNLNVPNVITTKAFDIRLPGIPVISVPSYDITTKYIQEKMAFVSLKIPQYEITTSSFVLPTSVGFGDYSISLNDITNKISNFKFPTVVVPEQKIEIPETTLYVPASVFIPNFGALSATVNVSSPIYSVSTTSSVTKKDSNLITSLHSICSSTMVFLEYELTAKATFGCDDEMMNLNGNWKLVHNDVNVNWQHNLNHDLRTKRQASRGDSTNQESRHTLNIDITGRSFADVNFRFASRKDGITASMLSPSAGFLGLHLQRRSPSQLVGKLFSRYLSTPEKDTNVFTTKASLRNSEKLVFQISWNWNFFNDFIEGIKNKIPAMTNAVFECVNKYHTSHFGMDLKHASMKLKTTISNFVEKLFQEASLSATAIRDVLQDFVNRAKVLYNKALNDRMTFQEFKDKVNQALESIKNKVFEDFISPVFYAKKFQVPGSKTKLSIVEMYKKAEHYVLKTTDRAVQQLSTLMEKISEHIENIHLTIPGTDVVLNGKEILDKVMSSLELAFDNIRRLIRRGVNLLDHAANESFNAITEKTEALLTYLKDRNSELTSKLDAIHAEVLQFLQQQSEEAKKHLSEYKDLIKSQIHEVYTSVNMENVNKKIREFIITLKSYLSETGAKIVHLMKKVSESTTPYVRVSNEKVDVEIPLPFLWKSFSEWPTHFRQ